MSNHKWFSRQKCGGFTLIELLVVIAIIAVLMAILMPALMRVREQAREIMCRANLRQYGLAQAMYLDDFDNRYPSAWRCLVKTEQPVPGYERYCRWHDPRYPPDGPFWPYLVDKKINLCPSFKVLAKYLGEAHPNHVASNPVVPFYSYSMNGYLGSKTGDPDGSGQADSTGRDGIYKLSEITRIKAEVFFFAEENMWTSRTTILQRPGCDNALNDNALCPDGRDWFATFHSTSSKDLNGGTCNAVFVDAHVDEVRSALKKNPNDNSEKEFGRFEKFGWPHKEPFR